MVNRRSTSFLKCMNRIFSATRGARGLSEFSSSWGYLLRILKRRLQPSGLCHPIVPPTITRMKGLTLPAQFLSRLQSGSSRHFERHLNSLALRSLLIPIIPDPESSPTTHINRFGSPTAYPLHL